ncbi:DUF1428 family protein [Alkalicoccobacillus gibsonii]|uniref:DUF1428 family protein n=1 Tax=Alkalicoccobacillus gibsonii TaxID=79881 RepID=UPI0035193372
MFIVLHLYPVQQECQDQLLEINNKAAIIYKEYGALEDKTLKHNSKKGNIAACMSMTVKESEVLYLGISQYKDKEHYDETILKVNQDSRIHILFEQFSKIVDVTRVINAEFEMV